MRPDGWGLEDFADGIRYAVDFDWNPATKELWFTDNGVDDMGDNIPPDELNHPPRPGMNFGFPDCLAGTIPGPGFNKEPCNKFTPPAINLGPHVAAIGMRFYTGTMFPQEYRNQIFIAEHGSWNRRVPIGYRVTLVRLEGNKAVKYEPFAEGWLQGSAAWGRPADVLVMPDGSLLVSADWADALYRVTYFAPRLETVGKHIHESDRKSGLPKSNPFAESDPLVRYRNMYCSPAANHEPISSNSVIITCCLDNVMWRVVMMPDLVHGKVQLLYLLLTC